MAIPYLGRLPAHDPLHHYLCDRILPQIGVSARHVNFRVFNMRGTKQVYLYEEEHSRALIVGKFFGNGNGKAARRMQREFDNLELLRSYGLAGKPHHVARPFGTNERLNGLLVEEYCQGASLSSILNGAIHDGHRDRLFHKLTALAWFLATLHNRTANHIGVDFRQDCIYFDRIIHTLLDNRTIASDDARELQELCARWCEQPYMWEDRQVLLHGDATPSNLLFGDDLQVIAIDLERVKRGDRVFDVGRIAGEVQHFFLQARHEKYAAEPFIGHFLWEYACHFPDRDRAFRSITRRVPFHMGLTLLRVARNSWLDSRYRRRLVEEAKITLRSV